MAAWYVNTSTGLVPINGFVNTASGLVQVIGNTVASVGTRDASLWPFAYDDAFNIGIGNAATWSATGSAQTTFAQGGGGGGNVNGAQQNPSYSIPVYVAVTGSPTVTIAGTSLKLPAGALPASGTDHHMTCVQPKSGTTYEMYGFYGVTYSGGTYSTTYGSNGPFDLSQYSTHYDGRASSIIQMAGLIRPFDIAQGVIQHAVAMALPETAMTTGPIFPATSQDSNASTNYTAGSNGIHMGAVIGIPSSVNVSSLGLTSAGLMLATALQNYGAIVTDTGGSGGVIFYAEDQYDEGVNTSTFTTAISNMNSDLVTITAQLRSLTNQQTSQSALTSSGGWGAGSTSSRASIAPAFAGSVKPIFMLANNILTQLYNGSYSSAAAALTAASTYNIGSSTTAGTPSGSNALELYDVKDNTQIPTTAPSGFTGVLYDAEDWSYTPSAQYNSPVSAYQTAKNSATAIGLPLIATPGTDLAAAISPGVSPQWQAILNANIPSSIAGFLTTQDTYEIQSQSEQTDPTGAFLSYVQGAVNQIRATGCQCTILAGLTTYDVGSSTAATLSELQAAAAAVSNIVQGFWLNVPSDPGLGAPNYALASQFLSVPNFTPCAPGGGASSSGSGVSTTVPSAPTGLAASPGSGTLTLSWTAPTSTGGTALTGYSFEVTPSGGSTVIHTTTATTTSYTLTGLTIGTSYTVGVAATNSVGTGAYSATTTGTPTGTVTVPNAPTNVVATPGNTTIALTWTAPSSNGGGAITGYSFVVTPSGGSATTKTASTAATSHTITTLVNGTLYSITVAATNSAGTGTASSAVTATPAASASVPSITTTSPLPAATVSSAYSVTLAASGSPTSWAITSGSIPGVTLNTSTGVLSGTPTTAGSDTITVTATNGTGTSAAVSLTVTVSAASTFVTKSGTTLVKNGSTFRFAGANIYWLGIDDNGGNITAPGYPTHAMIDAGLGEAQAIGCTVVRAHTLGISLPSVQASSVSLLTSSGGYNTAAFEPIDYAFQKAASLGLKLVIPLVDQWRYYNGGKWNFVHLRAGQTTTAASNGASYTIVDTINNTTANPPNAAQNSTEQNAENQFYTSLLIRGDFEAYISEILTHTNQYTGIKLGQDPVVLAWETGNEIYSATVEWTQAIATYIKTLTPALVADGSAADGLAVSAGPGISCSAIDIVGGHYYPAPGTALQGARGSTLTTDATSAINANKVFWCGEYPWANTASSADLQPWLAPIVTNTNASGAALWSIIAPGDSHGSGEDSNDASLYVPGTDAQMDASTGVLASFAQGMAGTTTAPTQFLAGTPAAAIINVAYSYSFASDGYPFPTYAITGTLPSGITASGGNLSGTPTASGTFSITCTSTNSAGSKSTTTNLVVGGAPSNLLPSAVASMAATADVGYGGATANVSETTTSSVYSTAVAFSFTGTGYPYIYTQNTTADMAPVTATTTYVAMCSAVIGSGNTGVTGGSVVIAWYNSSGGYLSNSSNGSYTNLSTTVAQMTVSATAPTNAAYASVQFQSGNSAAVGDTITLSKFGLFVGSTVPAWTA